MAEEPQFPPIPDIGEILYRKDRFVQKVTTMIKCKKCKGSYSRAFKEGDYTYKNITDEECLKCHESHDLKITEIYSEWIDPKKKK